MVEDTCCFLSVQITSWFGLFKCCLLKRVKFKFYFDRGQPLLCLIGMQQDMSRRPSCQVYFNSIFSVFPRIDLYKERDIFGFLKMADTKKEGSDVFFKIPSSLHSWLSSSLWAAAGLVDLSVTHLRAASRLRGVGVGVCVYVYARAVKTNVDSHDDEGSVVCQEQHTLILKLIYERSRQERDVNRLFLHTYIQQKYIKIKYHLGNFVCWTYCRNIYKKICKKILPG